MQPLAEPAPGNCLCLLHNPISSLLSPLQAAAWRREPSFADLLATQHGAACHGAERGSSPLAAPTLPPAVLPAAPSADDLPIGVAAEMATSPRKRARKRRVPVRSDTGDATLAAAQLPPLQGSSGSSSACAPGERPDGSADPFKDGSEADGAHSGPRKAPRCVPAYLPAGGCVALLCAICSAWLGRKSVLVCAIFSAWLGRTSVFVPPTCCCTCADAACQRAAPCEQAC